MNIGTRVIAYRGGEREEGVVLAHAPELDAVFVLFTGPPQYGETVLEGAWIPAGFVQELG